MPRCFLARFAGILIVVLVVNALGCATRSTPAPRVPVRNPSAIELGHCPFGHTHLKEVRIAYGLIAQDADFLRRQQDLEVWYGGCVISSDSPKVAVVCPECRFAYEPIRQLWYKSAERRDAFVRPFSKVAADFPVPRGAVVNYDQYVTGDGAILAEGVSYHAPDVTLDLASRINAHVQQDCPVRLESTASQFPAGTSLEVRGQRDADNSTGVGDGRVVEYYIEYRHDLGEASVSFTVARPGFHR